MKKNYFMGFIACAALTMTGCSNDEIGGNDGQTQGEPIEFGTYLGRDAQARGAITDNDVIQTADKGFGVLASYTKDEAFSNQATMNFMYNQQVTYSNSAWSYSPVKYWPTMTGEKVSFFAYAPFATENNGIKLSENDATGAPTATITLQNPDKMIDFVAGVQMNKTHDNGDNADNTVNFTLLHEMTRIGIQAKVSKDVYKTDADLNKTFVVIKNITLKNAATDGQFYKSAKYTFSTTTGTRGTWSAQSGSADVDINGVLSKTTITATGAVSGLPNGDYKTGVSGIKLEGTTAVSLFKDKNYLFLIPATANDGAGLTDGKATATIEYDIVTEDSKLAAGYSCTSATKTVNLPAGTMQQGVAYNYTFTIAVDEVKLSATVDAWDTTGSGNVDVPYTPDGFTTVTETPGGGTTSGPEASDSNTGDLVP